MTLPLLNSDALPTPRWQTPLPETVTGSYGPYVIDYARHVLGLELDAWQRKAINRALAHDDAGRLVHRIYLISVARQNGKTGLVRSLIGTALTSDWPLPWEHIAGMASDRKQGMLPYNAVLADLRPMYQRVGGEARGGLALTRYLGIRSAMHGRSREYSVYSKEARDAIRGASLDLILPDEVRTQRNYDLWAAIEPTTTARPMPLIVPTSTAGDDRSVLLRDWWERGRRIIDGAEPAQGFGMTWYAADDDLADLPHDDPRFRLALQQANPSFAEGRISAEAILAGVANSTGPSMVRAERLNLWTDAADEWLPPGLWQSRTGAQPASLDGVRITLGVDTVPSWRRATVSVGILHDSGAWVGIAGELDSSAGTIDPKDVQDMVEKLCQKWTPALVGVSASHPVAPYVQAAGAATATSVVAMSPRQIRAASQLLRAELIGQRLSHAEDRLLQMQVRQARPSTAIEGDDWYISVKESLGEVDAIRSAAWAAWVAIAPPDDTDTPQVFV